jgi:septal ring factor EnvC (AmiA/AmiB activator)
VRRRLLALTLGLALAASAAATEVPSPTRETREAELAEVRQRIQALRDRLEETRAAREGLQEELREVELAGAQIAAELRQLEQAVAAGRARLTALGREREGRERVLAAQRESLARLVRADYAAGRRDYLTLLLNQEDPSRLSRVLAYHRYVELARADEVARLRARVAELTELVTTLDREQEALRSLQAEKSEAQKALAEQRQVRAAVLARLGEEARTSGAELARLSANARQLEKLIEALRQALPDIPEGLGQQRRFSDRKGSLPWPSAGRLRAGFGAPRTGGLTWQGVVIDAPAGSPVLAVHPGRVAFADWLRGFGLLVIVDHGEGYMTLYGQNQGLLRQAGDWVEAGEAIATVGDSGGSSETGLYFEVRQKGTPLNPSQWCRGPPGRG